MSDELSYILNANRRYVPVSFVDFVSDRYYVGDLSDYLYDFWKEELSEFDNLSQYELILTGSFGSGKTTAASLFVLYRLYYLFSYRNFHSILGVPSSSYIYGVYLSISRTQAFLSGFRSIMDLLDSSRFFQENFPRNKELSSRISFKNISNFEIIFGSTVAHLKGLNVWFAMLDEADFFRKGGIGVDLDYVQVTSIYNELASRIKSRFESGKNDKSFLILISSASFKSSFLDNRIKESYEVKDVRVVNAVGYKIKPDYLYVEKFPVFVGYNEIEPVILSSLQEVGAVLFRFLRRDVDLSIYSDIKEVLEAFPEFSKYVEWVPVNLRRIYESDIYSALMNLSGIPVAREGRLVSSLHLLYENYSDQLVHPFTSESVVLSSGDDVPLSAYFIENLVRDKDKPHVIHIDQSRSKDSTGLAMVRFDGNSGGRREYSVVFALEIRPPKAPDEIKISKIRDFILYLYYDIGYNIVRVSMDQYQSAEHQQILKYDHGIDTVKYSVDKSDDAYVLFLSLLQDRSLKLYRYNKLEKELSECVHDRKRRKVDHPKGGCFLGSCEIFVVDYGFITFEEGVKLGSVISYGIDLYGSVVETVLYNFHITKYVKFLVRVYVSEYEYYDCTEDHLWMLSDGSYVEARFLVKGNVLASVFYPITVNRVERIELDEEVAVYDCTSMLTGNFTLACGAVVHNSIDVLQAVVGALYNLSTVVDGSYSGEFDESVFLVKNSEDVLDVDKNFFEVGGRKFLKDRDEFFKELDKNRLKLKRNDYLSNLGKI